MRKREKNYFLLFPSLAHIKARKMKNSLEKISITQIKSFHVILDLYTSNMGKEKGVNM